MVFVKIINNDQKLAIISISSINISNNSSSSSNSIQPEFILIYLLLVLTNKLG